MLWWVSIRCLWVSSTGSAGLILENDETITNSTDGTVLINGIVAAGTGSAPGVFQSNGNFDVTLQTGNSTTGSITITDGANGNISITPNGSGIIALGGNMTIPDAGTIGSASDTDAISISSAGLVNVSQTATVGTSTAAGDMSDLLSPDQKILYGFLRLRINDNNTDIIYKELHNCTFIRELHVYGSIVDHSSKKGNVQHMGFGKKMMKVAEDISRARGFKKVAVISGVGVRGYYASQGYKLVKDYMVKELEDNIIMNEIYNDIYFLFAIILTIILLFIFV